MMRRILVLALLLGAPRLAAAQRGYKVIVNPASTVSAVTKKELTAVFLKKSERWSDGTPATAVDLPEMAEARQGFSRDVLGKAPSAVRAYWNQMVFSGRSVPPSEKESEADVIAYVRRTPGAVGYVSAGAATTGVKVIQIKS